MVFVREESLLVGLVVGDVNGGNGEGRYAKGEEGFVYINRDKGVADGGGDAESKRISVGIRDAVSKAIGLEGETGGNGLVGERGWREREGDVERGLVVGGGEEGRPGGSGEGGGDA